MNEQRTGHAFCVRRQEIPSTSRRRCPAHFPGLWRKSFILALVFFSTAAGIFGQSHKSFESELNEIRTGSVFRLAFIRIIPVFRLSDIGYDNNVYYRDRGDTSVSDYSGRIAADIGAYWILGNSLILSFEYNPDYLFYLKEKQLRRLTHSYSPAFRLLLFKRFVLSGEFHDRKSVRRAFSEFDRPIEDRQKGFAAGLFIETPRMTALGFTGTIDEFYYRDVSDLEGPADYAGSLDREERTGTFEFYYRAFSESFFFYTVGLTEYKFLSPDASWRNARSLQTKGGIRFPFIGRARGTLSLGYKKFTPENESLKPFSGLVASTDLSLRTGRFGFQLGYVRDNFFSYLDTAYYYVEDSFKAGLSFYIFSFLRLDGSVRFGSMKYPGSHLVWYQGEYFLVENRKDLNHMASIGLAFRVRGDMGLGINFNLYSRESNAPGFNIDRNFIGAFITYDF